MPLSEFYRMAKSKLESSQQMPTSSSADLTFLPDNEFVELVWENGPVMMQSQSSKSRKNPNSNNFPSNTTKFRDRKFGLGQQQSNLNDFSSSVPSVEAGLNQDNDLVPWLNYPIEETLDQDYGSEFLAELAGVKDNNYSNQAFRNSEQGQASDKITSDLPCLKQNSGLSSNSSGLLNFSHFSRPAAIVRANLHNLVMGNKDKGCVMAPNDRSKPSIVNSRFLSKPNLVSSNVDSAQITAKPIEELRVSEQSDVVCQKDAAKSDKSTSPDCEKTVEPVVASSVCSGNSGERASDDMTNNMKRKCRDEESECPSEDIEEESFKRGANARGGSGSKRSRAAEVHNLSERRRRDRINEKMRALQELIPNCNKVDKASMLDEAIEYLKTLQLQVQIMSMGAGLCMPPMMFPTGMQHIHFPHIPHFPSMMGMGTSYGMGMLDMNGAPRFPSPLMPGPANFQAMAGHNIPVFGHPAQGVPVSVPGAPFVHMSGCPPMNFAMAPDNSTMIQKPSQFQDQPVTAQKLDQPPPDLTTTAAVTLTKTKDNLPSKTPGCD